MAMKINAIKTIPEITNFSGSPRANMKPNISVANIRDQCAITPNNERVSSSIPFCNMLKIFPVPRASIFP